MATKSVVYWIFLMPCDEFSHCRNGSVLDGVECKVNQVHPESPLEMHVKCTFQVAALSGPHLISSPKSYWSLRLEKRCLESHCNPKGLLFCDLNEDWTLSHQSQLCHIAKSQQRSSLRRDEKKGIFTHRLERELSRYLLQEWNCKPSHAEWLVGACFSMQEIEKWTWRHVRYTINVVLWEWSPESATDLWRQGDFTGMKMSIWGGKMITSRAWISVPTMSSEILIA